jgi:hypothetical protein
LAGLTNVVHPHVLLRQLKSHKRWHEHAAPYSVVSDGDMLDVLDVMMEVEAAAV